MMMESHCNEDRLSSLPEHILVDILSLLPLESVIVTSVLSRRWRHLWTRITSFNIIDYDNIFFHKVGYMKMLAIYNKLLKQLTSPSITTFEIHISTRMWWINATIESWLIQVCARNVEKIKVYIQSGWVPPPCVFLTKSIVELDLQNLNISNLPKVTDLPNLKKIRISRSYTYSPITEVFNFINFCSSIEDLYLHININRGKDVFSDVEIMGANLRRLDLELYDFYYILVIDAPNLEYLIVRLPMKFRFVQIPKALLVAKLLHWKVGYNLEHVGYNLEPIAQCVRSLHVGLGSCEHPEMFPHLTSLNVDFEEACDFNRLMKFLKFCPVLEVIRLKMNLRPCEIDDWQKIKWPLWRLEQFQTNMKKIEIELENAKSVLKHQTHVVTMVKYLVRSVSKDLKQLTLGFSIYDFHASSFSTLGKKLKKNLMKVIKVSNYETDSSNDTYWSFVARF